jgi:hypothetical protein
MKTRVSVLRLHKHEPGAITQQGRPKVPGHEELSNQREFHDRILETIRFQVASWCATNITKFVNPRLAAGCIEPRATVVGLVDYFLHLQRLTV